MNETTGSNALFGKPKPQATATVDSAGADIGKVADQVDSGATQRAFGNQGQVDANQELSSGQQVETIAAKSELQSQVSQLKADSIDAVAQLDGNSLAPVESGTATFSSAPIQRLKVGRFRFEKGVLQLSGDDLTEFRGLMAKMDVRTQAGIRTINVAAANAVAQTFLDSHRVRGVDTSQDRPGVF